jgi:hypothetical protein
LARTGTVVSSPWIRSAVSTWCLSKAVGGDSAVGAGPDSVGQRRDAEIETFARELLALPIEWLMLPELAAQDGRQQIGTGAAAGDRWNGAGGWVMLSQERQENFSRTVWITL